MNIKMHVSCNCIRNTIFIHIRYAGAVWSVIAVFSGQKWEKKPSKAFWLTFRKKNIWSQINIFVFVRKLFTNSRINQNLFSHIY